MPTGASFFISDLFFLNFFFKSPEALSVLPFMKGCVVWALLSLFKVKWAVAEYPSAE